MLQAAGLVILSVLLVDCTAVRYEGQVAILRGPGIEVVKSETDWGDCHRRDSPVPTVYQVAREEYVLSVAHGDRYWPQFFLGAAGRDGETLELVGSGIKRLDAAVIDSLAQARMIVVSHSSGDHLDRPPQPLVVEVRKQNGELVGQEELRFDILVVRCVNWVGL